MTGSGLVRQAGGGHTGLLTAIAAVCLAVAEVLSETAGREILPIGRLGAGRGASRVGDLGLASAD